MRRGDPEIADDLLTSAIHHLNEQDPGYTTNPWRTYMPQANATAKKAEEKAALKALAAKGITKPKHRPGESAPGVKAAWPGTTRAVAKSGVDTDPTHVVQSSVDSDTTNPEGNTMTTETKTKPAPKAVDPVAAAEKKVADQKAADKVKAQADASAAKAKKLEEATKAKEAAALERKAALEKAAKERSEKQAANLEARKAAAEGTKRTYFGSMTALADRVKSGVYVKGMTGQLRSSDDLALALDAVPTDNVIKLGLLVLGLATNPYAALNRGQQSMNLRNKMRGALKADDGKGMVVPGSNPEQRVTLEYIKKLRDDNGFATAEDAAAKRAEAKVKREKEAAEKKAAAEVEKAKKAEAAKAAKPAPATPAAAA